MQMFFLLVLSKLNPDNKSMNLRDGTPLPRDLKKLLMKLDFYLLPVRNQQDTLRQKAQLKKLKKSSRPLLKKETIFSKNLLIVKHYFQKGLYTCQFQLRQSIHLFILNTERYRRIKCLCLKTCWLIFLMY